MDGTHLLRKLISEHLTLLWLALQNRTLYLFFHPLSRNHVISTISNFLYWTGTSSEPEITVHYVGARKQNKDFTGIQGDGLKFAAPKSSSMHFVKALEDGIIVEQWWHSGESTRLPPNCGWGSVSRLVVTCGLSLLVFFSALRGFSPGTPVFPSPQKTCIWFNMIWLIWFAQTTPQALSYETHSV